MAEKTGDQTQEMERMVDKLEAMFQKTESDVEYMSRKLENEFQEGAQEKNQTSPLELSQRLEQVKHDYKSIMEETEGIKKAQEEMISSIKQQLMAASHAIQKLHQTTGTELPDVSEQEALVQSLLGISLSSSAPVPVSQGSVPSQPQTEQSSVPPLQLDEELHNAEEEENLSPIDTTFDISPSPAELRAGSSEMVPVTEEEFTSVSDLIRGRAKLEDVNRVYSRLYDHFKTERNTAPLSVPEMSKMGMKITGATGEAKLKTLRSLKIINITRTGAVKLS
nr:spindle and kinetochore-associated protein 2-like [Lytechinus pictus]